MSVLVTHGGGTRLPLRDGRAVTLRPAVEDDAAAMVAYMHAVLPEVRSYVVTLPEEFDRTVEQEREWLREHVRNGGVVLLACNGDEVVGMCDCRPGLRRRIAHVATLGVTLRESWRGVGLGEAMLHWMIDWAEHHPTIAKLALSVLADNERAIRLYRKCGFVEEGRRIGEVQRDPGEFVDDLLMYRWIKSAATCVAAQPSRGVPAPGAAQPRA